MVVYFGGTELHAYRKMKETKSAIIFSYYDLELDPRFPFRKDCFKEYVKEKMRFLRRQGLLIDKKI